MLSRKHIKPLFLFAAVAVGIYYSPHLFSRVCVSEGSVLSNRSIVEQTAAWFIENERPGAVLEDGGWFGNYFLAERGKVVLTFEIGKFDLWDPLFSDYPNYVYVYNGGNKFFIFDACGHLVDGKL